MNPDQSPNPNEQPAPAVKEQPVVQAPAANYQQPTTTEQQTAYNDQPVQQQYFAQPNAAPVQYVVQAKGLKGIRGWLAFFMIMAGFIALGYAGIIINSIDNLPSTSAIINVIFSPIILAAALAAVALIAMEKKVARPAYVAFSVILLLHSVVSSAATEDTSSVIAGILTGGVWLSFVALYFMNSKRVKETLVK